MRCTPEELLTTCNELATLPETVIRLLDVLEEPTVSVDEVLVILERDPAMTANLLKLANSAYYGMRRKIATARQALVLLGNRAVAMLTFATGMTPILRRDLVAYGLAKETFWRHALIAAAASARIADLRAGAESGEPDYRSQAFTAGLLHDVGKLLIDAACVRYGQRIEPAVLGGDLRSAEREVIGCDHCEAGEALGRQWGFPTELVVALRWHHEPSGAPYHEAVAVAATAGDRIAHYLDDDGGEGPANTDFPATLAELAITPQIVSDFQAALVDDLQELLRASTAPIAS